MILQLSFSYPQNISIAATEMGYAREILLDVSFYMCGRFFACARKYRDFFPNGLSINFQKQKTEIFAKCGVKYFEIGVSLPLFCVFSWGAPNHDKFSV